MSATTAPAPSTAPFAVAVFPADGPGSGCAKVITVGEIAAAVGGVLDGPADVVITGLASLDQAVRVTEGAGSLTFIRSAKFAAQWASSKAVAALVTNGVEVPGHDASTRALITVGNADVAMAQVLAMFAPKVHGPAAGVHPSAVVDPTAQIGQGACIGATCVVGPRTRIGDGAVLHANVTLGADVSVGPMTTIHPGVVIYDRCSVGAKCILFGNVVIGADGFGYVPDPQGRGLIKLPHIGTVEIGNMVEIGACSCVDRGKFGATTIGDMTKIDNLVQIGHNVRIGRACIICGGSALGGSAVLEDVVVLAGQVGIEDGKRVGTLATISAQSGVMVDVPPGETWFGTPAGPHKDQMRSYVALRQLSQHMREMRRLARAAKKDRPAT